MLLFTKHHTAQIFERIFHFSGKSFVEPRIPRLICLDEPMPFQVRPSRHRSYRLYCKTEPNFDFYPRINLKFKFEMHKVPRIRYYKVWEVWYGLWTLSFSHNNMYISHIQSFNRYYIRYEMNQKKKGKWKQERNRNNKRVVRKWNDIKRIVYCIPHVRVENTIYYLQWYSLVVCICLLRTLFCPALNFRPDFGSFSKNQHHPRLIQAKKKRNK